MSQRRGVIELAAKKTDTLEKDAAKRTDTQKFGREQVLASARYQGRKDLVSALLQDGGKYATAEVDRLMDDFLKGKVK